jgi:uncharacterized membrane protein
MDKTRLEAFSDGVIAILIRILWANSHLLFWLSLVPFATAWMGEAHFAALPTAFYGGILLSAGAAYTILVWALLAGGANPRLARAIGHDLKGKSSIVLYVAAIGLAFINVWLADGLYVLVALIWLVPDRRIEKRLQSAD